MEGNETIYTDKNGNNKYFVCEICGCETLVPFEGAEPNVCAMCLPLEIAEENCDYDKQNAYFE